MTDLQTLGFQIRRARDVAKTQNGCELGLFEPCSVVQSQEEKDYQQLVNNKLKAAADWDFRDSRQFTIA